MRVHVESGLSSTVYVCVFGNWRTSWCLRYHRHGCVIDLATVIVLSTGYVYVCVAIGLITMSACEHVLVVNMAVEALMSA